MKAEKKTSQLQIRISAPAKARLERAAARAGKDVSSYVLDTVLPPQRAAFERIVRRLQGADERAYVLSELHDLLAALGRGEFGDVVGCPKNGVRPRGVAAGLEPSVAQTPVSRAQRVIA